MSKAKQNDPELTYEQTVYHLNGITYLPHYRNCEIFIGPGYPRHNLKRYSSRELEQLGAVAAKEFLWIRGNFGKVSDGNP